MKYPLLFISLLAAITTFAHPGIGIVRDSKGFIYYTDLTNVYRLDPSTNKKSIAVPNVHTHQLYMDAQDNLYGEHLWYADEATNRFDHYLWKLSAEDKLETISGTSNAYADFDFSLVRDNEGNQYRVQALTTDHILKKTKEGTVETIASGSFKNVSWLQPAGDGTLYFSNGNAVFKIAGGAGVVKVAGPVSSNENDPAIYRIWQKETAGPLYVAVASEHAIKIDSSGLIENFFIEKGNNWLITGGVFDKEGELWVLEYNHNNEVRVIHAGKEKQPASIQYTISKFRYWIVGFLFAAITIFLLRGRKQHRKSEME
jgi:hypothetical protein